MIVACIDPILFLLAALVACVLFGVKVTVTMRQAKCGAIAPIDAELGMAVCVEPDDHDGPHRDHRGDEWDAGPGVRSNC